MTREVIKSANAPKAIGPYSQAIKVDGWVFCSGQIPVNPETGEITGGIAVQTERCLENLSGVLDAAGAELSDAVKVTVFLKNMDDFAEMNEVYKRFFVVDPPARACVEVARLPKDVLIEIELIARTG